MVASTGLICLLITKLFKEISDFGDLPETHCSQGGGAETIHEIKKLGKIFRTAENQKSEIELYRKSDRFNKYQLTYCSG